MATRYSKRKADGTVEYYDTQEELQAANPPTTTIEALKAFTHGFSSSFNPFFAFWAFVIAIIVSIYVGAQYPEIAKTVKIVLSLTASSIVAYVTGKFGNFALLVTVALMAIGLVCLIAFGSWKII